MLTTKDSASLPSTTALSGEFRRDKKAWLDLPLTADHSELRRDMIRQFPFDLPLFYTKFPRQKQNLQNGIFV
jgi:hypothetical protein